MISFPSTPVSYETLQGQNYLSPSHFGAFLKTPFFPVLITELASLIGQYVLAFRKQDEVFFPVALTDIGFNRNLYVSRDGRWMCHYIPLCLQNFPFCLAPDEAGARVISVATDQLLPHGHEGGLPLFKEDGSLAEGVENSRSRLEKLDELFRRNARKTKVLSDEGLIAEWPMKVRLEQGKEPVSVDGLYRIDPEKLLALSGDRLEHLKNHGVLTFALSQPMSMQHTNVLMERASYLIRQEARNKSAVAPTKEPGNPSFDLSDDEMISF